MEFESEVLSICRQNSEILLRLPNPQRIPSEKRPQMKEREGRIAVGKVIITFIFLFFYCRGRKEEKACFQTMPVNVVDSNYADYDDSQQNL